MSLSGHNRLMRLGLILSFGLIGLLYLANLFLGEINQDEGWYLYAARTVREGLLPYRDFAFTQAPGLPLLYAPLYFMVDHFGLGGGRVITILFGLGSILLAGATAVKLTPAGWGTSAFLATATLAGLNVYHSYFTTIVKTYALASFLLMAGIYFLLRAFQKNRSWCFVLSGLLLSAAAGTRLSAVAALGAAGLFLLFMIPRRGHAAWLFFSLGAALGAVLFFGIWYIAAPDGFVFAMIDYHKARTAGSLANTLVYKAGFISRLVQAYFMLFVALTGLAVIILTAQTPFFKLNPREVDRKYFLLFMLTAVCGVTALHFSAPFPYDDYQVFIMPLLAAAVSAGWISFLSADDQQPEHTPVAVYTLALVIFSAAAAFSSPVNQAWFIRGRDRIWWQMKDAPALLQLQNAAREILRLSGPEKELLTMDTYLAVETGMKVPRGMEMGPFCYYPDLSTEKARRLHLLNKTLLAEIIRTTPATVAANSGYGFSIRSPEISELTDAERAELYSLICEKYQIEKIIPCFGQAATDLRILKAK